MPKQIRWINRPAGSNWGEFGVDDQLGRLNLITAKKLREGLAEVIDGKVFCLSLPLDLPGGSVLNRRRHQPLTVPTYRGATPNVNYPLAGDGITATDIINDDILTIPTHYSTHWDALAHMGQMFDADGDGVAEPVFYNGYRAGEHVGLICEPGDSSASVCCRSPYLGIEHVAATGLQGRGVLVDIEAHLGPGRTIVTFAVLQQILEADAIDVREGDILCLHTGFAQALVEFGGEPDAEALRQRGAELDGRDPALLNWISETGIAAIAADNLGVEAMPPATPAVCSAAMPLHEHCLFKLGMPLGELWHLTPLARYLSARRRHAFLLTAPPLRMPGAVGSPTTPVATV